MGEGDSLLDRMSWLIRTSGSTLVEFIFELLRSSTTCGKATDKQGRISRMLRGLRDQHGAGRCRGFREGWKPEMATERFFIPGRCIFHMADRTTSTIGYHTR